MKIYEFLFLVFIGLWLSSARCQNTETMAPATEVTLGTCRQACGAFPFVQCGKAMLSALRIGEMVDLTGSCEDACTPFADRFDLQCLAIATNCDEVERCLEE